MSKKVILILLEILILSCDLSINKEQKTKEKHLKSKNLKNKILKNKSLKNRNKMQQK